MKKKYLIYCILIIFLNASFLFTKDVSILEIPLSISEKNAEKNSARLKSAEYEYRGFEERAYEQKTLLYPRISLDGTFRYNTEVQEIDFKIPGMKAKKFGDNTNYSIGPSIVWTAWDNGGANNAYKSIKSNVEAKRNEVEGIKRQLIFSVRLAYFQVAVAGEQVKLLADALILTKAQYKDIKINVRAGTKSLVDELSAHQEVLTRVKQLRQAMTDMALAIRDLAAITGQEYTDDVSIPIDSRINFSLSEEISEPTVKVRLESIDSLLEKFIPYRKLKINERHPSLEALAKTAESTEFLISSIQTGRWPRVQLMAKTSIDYPFGTKLENYNQNTIGANFSLPLYEAGLTKKRVSENENILSAILERKRQLNTDFIRDWNKTMDQLANLEEQRKLNEISVSETEQLSGIIYKSYKTGSLSYLEVQNANFKALEAKIQSARTKVQILMNLSALANLAE